MSGAVTAAVVVSAAVVGSSVYSAQAQKSAAKKQAEATVQAQQAQEAADREVAAQQSQYELEAEQRASSLRNNVSNTESAKVTYGMDASKKNYSVASDLLSPKKSTTSVGLGGSSSSRTGLGF